LGQNPIAVACHGKAHVNMEIEDITTTTIEFPDRKIAIIQSSWLDPNKIRKMTIVGSKRMLVYDDNEPLEKIKIYDKHVEVPPHYDTFAEFHYSYHYGDVHSPYIKQAEPLKVLCQHFLDCIRTDAKPDSSGLRGNYRSRIQKAEKMDVRVDIHHSPEAMNQYYRLHCCSRKRHGLPPQPLHFFRKIYQHIVSQNLGFVVLATHHTSTISGAVCVHFGRQILYKYAAMDSSCQPIPASYLLFWRIIQWACQNGFQKFCFGKSDAEQEGLILFKDGWRAEKQVLRYYRYSIKKETFMQTEQRSDGRGYFWFRAMPLPFLKKVGSLLYRHVG
jgi:hypothetical protein